MATFPRILALLCALYTLGRETEGFNLGGGGFRFPMPPLGPVFLPQVNSSSRWGDILEDTVLHALDFCKSVRMCNMTNLDTFYDSECSECHPCSCDKGCYKRGDCCVDKQLRDVSEELVVDTYLPETSPLFSCHTTCINQYEHAPHVLLVDKCPDSFSDPDTVSRCQNPTPNNTFSHWPVWSSTSNTVYQNMDCASCNSESLQHVLRWNLKVQCDKSIYIEHSHNIVTIVEKAFEEPSCQIVFTPPRGCSPNPCRRANSQYINTCNTTGQRHSYDQALWEACEVFHGEISLAGSTFKNVFCAMCNFERVSVPGSCHDHLPYPFFLEMDGASFLPDPVSAEGRCSCKESEIYDQYEKQCRPLACSMTRALQDGQCQSVVTNSTGLFYDLALSLTPTHTQLPVLLTQTSSLTQVARNIRTSFLLQGSAPSGWDVSTPLFRVIADTEAPLQPDGTIDQDVVRVRRFKVLIRFSPNWPEPSGTLEKRLFALIESQWNISVDGQPKRSFSAAHVYIGAHLRNMTTTFQSVSLLSSGENSKEFVVDILDSQAEGEDDLPLQTNYFLHISQALLCPKVSFSPFQQDRLVVNKTSGSILHVPSGKVISFEFVELGQKGEILICADKLFDADDDDSRRPVSVSFVSSQVSVITIVCQVVSGLCLLLVLITFLAFAELRTVTGKNMIALIITLILTVALTGNSMFGVGSTESCRIVGIISHFVFLSAFVWVIICMFHSFYMFKFSIRPRDGAFLNHSRIFVKYVIVSILVPVMIVVGTITANIIMNRGGCSWDLGYGHKTCFVSGVGGFWKGAWMPVFVIALSVLVLVLAVQERRKGFDNENIESSLQHFQLLLAHAVLSLLMGLTWLMEMIALLKEAAILWYVFLALQLLLAIYTVVVFLCKKQVMKLWHSCLVAFFFKDRRAHKNHKFSPVET